MKKLRLLLTVSVAAMTLMFTSCKPDDTVDPVGPSFDFTASSAKSFSVKPNDTVTFTVVTAKGDKNLDKLTFRVSGNPVLKTRVLVNGEVLSTDGEYKIKASEDAGKTYTIKYVAASTSATESLVVAAIDNDALTAGLTVTVTTSSYATTSYSARLVGAQSNVELGSYLSTSGVVTGQATATTATDMMLSFAQLGLSFTPTLISTKTDDRTPEGLTKGSTSSATTYFSSTSLTMNASGDDIAAATVGATAKKITVAKDGVYLFQQGNIKGLVKVTSLSVVSTAATGTATIDVKTVTIAGESVAALAEAK